MSKSYIIKVILCCLLILIVGCISASSSGSLPESDHPYPDKLEHKWPDITIPNATQMRLHFEYIDLNSGDRLILYDGFGHQLTSYPSGFAAGFTKENLWTDWYATDTLGVKLETDNSETAKGFKIDNVETRTNESLSDNPPESYHPYANNFEYKWPDITRPNTIRMKLHFEYINLNSGDRLILYDGFGNQLTSYPSGFPTGVTEKNYSTDWYKTDRIGVELRTDGSGTAQGFKIDNIETSNTDSSNTDSSIIGPSNTDSSNVSTATMLISSANSSIFRQSVTLTAKVDTLSKATEEPFGTVTFMDENKPIETADLISGQATLNVSSLSIGPHLITARYNGNIGFKPSTSSLFTLTVEKQPSTEQNPEIEQNVHTKQTDAEPSQTDKEPIWKNPIFDSLVVTIVGGIIVNNVPSLKGKVNAKVKK